MGRQFTGVGHFSLPYALLRYPIVGTPLELLNEIVESPFLKREDNHDCKSAVSIGSFNCNV